MKGLIAILSRHGRFYIALACGLGTALVAWLLGFDAPLLAGGDVFYLVFLVLCGVMIAGQTASDLKQRAKSEDEGIAIVLLITLATMGSSATRCSPPSTRSTGWIFRRWCWRGSARRWAGWCCTP